MAVIKNKKRLVWTAPPDTDVVEYNIYAGPPDDTGFVDRVTAGQIDEPHSKSATPSWLIAGLVEGDYQFAVTAVDDAGNESDPLQAEAWKLVPLDLTPPQAPTGGGIELVEDE